MRCRRGRKMLCENCRKKIKVPRTERQLEIWNYYTDFIRRRGFIPSYAMIARHIGVRSKATIAKHMRALREQGYLLPERRRPEKLLSAKYLAWAGHLRAIRDALFYRRNYG